MKRHSCRCSVLSLLACLFCCSALRGADHFLTIGGGANPGNNQISLEKNVLYFQKILADLAPRASHDIFFGDGLTRGRDLQFRDSAASTPRLNILLTQINGRGDGDLQMAYRPHQIPGLTGPSTRQQITQWFEKTHPALNDGDRLFVYFTGHGGGGNPARNTTLTLWDEPAMPVKDFAKLLDKLPAKVAVVMIMVQCHSGGFADVIFKDATAGPTLTDADRCGFFATLPERLAAGCTPDIAEDNYHEYSTYFFEALYGKSRKGAAIDKPDYNHDGRTSFAEAHAYVQLTSDTIDIPVATSDVFLRQFSKSKPATTQPAAGAKLLTMESPIDKLLDAATPSQRAVIEGLSTQLKLYGPDRAKAAREGADKIDKERKAVDQSKNRLSAEQNRIRNEIRGRLRIAWPELNNPWHPRVPAILASDADKIVQAIEAHPNFKRFEQLEKQIDEQSTASSNLERQWVKLQRVLYVLESLALSANLDQIAAEPVRERYQSLLRAEAGTLP